VQPVFQNQILVAEQLQISFVDERRRLQRVVWPLAPHIARSQRPQLVINEHEQLVEGFGASSAPRFQQLSNLRGDSHTLLNDERLLLKLPQKKPALARVGSDPWVSTQVCKPFACSVWLKGHFGVSNSRFG